MRVLLAAMFFLLLGVPVPHAHAGNDSHLSATVECHCPPDCHCHQPGGTCPGGTCVPDCDCDKIQSEEGEVDAFDGRGIWVHPEQRAAILRTQKLLNGGDKKLRGAPTPSGSGDFIYVNGVKQYTGYHPTWAQYDGATFKNFNDYSGHTAGDDFPLELDYRNIGSSPVRGQQCGDCWAQGGVSAFEFVVSAGDRVSRIFSVQDVIDNSGFGSCGGGQLSMAHFEKGAALEAEYPYLHGRNGQRKNNVSRYEKALETGYLRGSDGKFPTLPDIKRALMETGAMEVCGSASALGNGGRQDTVRSGSTNHCYALVGWLNGKKQGWLDADYLIIKNSWGDGDSSNALSNGRSWGDKGYGYYPLAKGDGMNLRGSVITEIQWARYKPMKPPEPINISVDVDQTHLDVTILPGAPYTADEVKKYLTSILTDLEK